LTANSTVQTLAIVSTYIPRKCGIATFAYELRKAIASDVSHPQALVFGLDDIPNGYTYPPEVRFQIQANQPRDYREAAELLNINQIDIALIQHEFGIFGGPAGNLILNLIRRLRMPVATTLHTVLSHPNREQAYVMKELIRLSDRLIVMCETAREMLENIHQVPSQKIAVIPHGVPDVPFVDSIFHKDQFGLEGRTVLMTFGLLSPGKGLEVVIRSLPEIVKHHPEAVYVILGAIHPNVFKREGNAYLVSLEQLADKLGVRDHVIFFNRFVSQEELCRYLGAVDIYITPYPNKMQITSGTLAYAIGMGKAVVSTPYWYAEEMLSNDRGRLFTFGDSGQLAHIVCELLDDSNMRDSIRKRAYIEGRNMIWPEVAKRYLALGSEIMAERENTPKPVSLFKPQNHDTEVLPLVNLKHLFAMTDDTGILQHAIYAVPDRFYGYCVDDNSRALIVAIRHYDMTKDETIFPLINKYLSFIYYAFDTEIRRFKNMLTYDRHWVDDGGSDDVQGRALWSLGETVSLAPNDAVLSFASRLFCHAINSMEPISSPRAWAFAILGCESYLKRFSGDAHVRRIRNLLANRLLELFKNNGSTDWPWCENIITYDNARLTQALILAGQSLEETEMIDKGIQMLEWLYNLQLTDDGTISLIGNQGWLEKSGIRARFDQQPIDAQALTEACADAYRFTQAPLWKDRTRKCLQWFLGNNDTQSVLVDYATGGCHDGLHSTGPNLNQGAESTLAWLISLITVHALEHEEELTPTEFAATIQDASGSARNVSFLSFPDNNNTKKISSEIRK
jgi:glycosyltransferase involved in cell wall biosynthesis